MTNYATNAAKEIRSHIREFGANAGMSAHSLGVITNIIDSHMRATIERLEGEKKSRIFYQDIVYKACNLVDGLLNRHPMAGTGTTDVGLPDGIKSVGEELHKAREAGHAKPADAESGTSASGSKKETTASGLPQTTMDDRNWEVTRLIRERDSLQSKLDAAVKVIERYANPGFWECDRLDGEPHIPPIPHTDEAGHDRGQIARDFLSKQEGK